MTKAVPGEPQSVQARKNSSIMTSGFSGRATENLTIAVPVHGMVQYECDDLSAS